MPQEQGAAGEAETEVTKDGAAGVDEGGGRRATRGLPGVEEERAEVKGKAEAGRVAEEEEEEEAAAEPEGPDAPPEWLALAEAAEAEAEAACTPSDTCKCEVGWAVEVRGEHVHGSFLGAVEVRRAVLAAQLEALEAEAAAEAAAEVEEAQAVLHETAAQRTLGCELGQQHCALRARASDMLREVAALRHEATERQAKAAAITVPLAALRVALLPLLPQLHSREHGVADQLAEVEGLQPYAPRAATLCVTGCNLMC